MHIQADPIKDGIAVLSLSGRIKRASHVHDLLERCSRLIAAGARGIVLDLSRVRTANYAGIAALVELVARMPLAAIAYTGLNPKIQRRLEASGLDRGLLVLPTIQDALRHDAFKSIGLSRVQVIIACDNFGSVFRPLLDVLGKPALIRSVASLKSQGLKKLMVHTRGQRPEVDQCLAQNLPCRDQILLSQQAVDDHKSGPYQQDDFAEALHDIRLRHGAFTTDVIFVSGNVLTTVDIGLMFQEHRQADADLTIAKQKHPSRRSATPRVAAFILKPWVVEMLANGTQFAMPQDVIRSVQAAQGKVLHFETDAACFDLNIWSHYAALLRKGLEGDVAGCNPVGLQVEAGFWRAPNARVARGAKIVGPCYLGQDAQLSPGSELRGPSIIGNRCRIEGKTLLRNCIVASDTYVRAGVWGENRIMTHHWNVDFRHRPRAGQTTIEGEDFSEFGDAVTGVRQYA